MAARVKKNDIVIVMSGKDKGKQGKVIEVVPKKDKVLVKGIAFVTRHVKARRQGEAGGIKKEESYIKLAKVMPVCVACKQPCRVNTKLLEKGKQMARVCNKCKELF
ncbi:50S ribosomal protein L24 [Candidatus Dependentiae bacterium]|nr:50S ribosomal protein L24 [Candidatus Dependentiae bacterium]